MKKIALFFGAVLFFLFFAPPADAAVPADNEYYGMVLIIDHHTGQFGIEVEDEKGKRKLAFAANLAKVDVLDQRSRDLDFKEVRPGDTVTVYTRPSAGKPETVLQIYDYNRLAQQ